VQGRYSWKTSTRAWYICFSVAPTQTQTQHTHTHMSSCLAEKASCCHTTRIIVVLLSPLLFAFALFAAAFHSCGTHRDAVRPVYRLRFRAVWSREPATAALPPFQLPPTARHLRLQRTRRNWLPEIRGRCLRYAESLVEPQRRIHLILLRA
jgi:hypothetical protein